MVMEDVHSIALMILVLTTVDVHLDTLSPAMEGIA